MGLEGLRSWRDILILCLVHLDIRASSKEQGLVAGPCGFERMRRKDGAIRDESGGPRGVRRAAPRGVESRKCATRPENAAFRSRGSRGDMAIGTRVSDGQEESSKFQVSVEPWKGEVRCEHRCENGTGRSEEALAWEQASQTPCSVFHAVRDQNYTFYLTASWIILLHPVSTLLTMADTVASSAPAAAPAATSPKKSKASSGKKPRAKPNHPRTSEMVSSAIKSLKERGGSSLQAIKKYIAANYKVDPEKFAPFIKKYLKAAVASGELVQTKGKGASGSFKLSSSAKPEKAAASSAPARGRGASGPKEKKQAPAKAKRSAPKSPKKAAAKKGAERKKQPSAAKPKKSPSKAKKVSKVPTKKPKAPKPKKVAKAPKKASPKKK